MNYDQENNASLNRNNVLDIHNSEDLFRSLAVGGILPILWMRIEWVQCRRTLRAGIRDGTVPAKLPRVGIVFCRSYPTAIRGDFRLVPSIFVAGFVAHGDAVAGLTARCGQLY